MDDFFSLSDLIHHALDKYKMNREARAALVCQRFRDLMPGIVGADAKGLVKPKYLKGKVLFVSVPSSVWAQRVYVHRHELLMKLRLSLADNSGVKDLKVRVE